MTLLFFVPRNLKIGKEKVGNYTVDTKDKSKYLGGGSFGQVYLAKDKMTGEKAAAKKLLTHHNDEMREMIQMEFKSMESIQNHPNVLKLLHAEIEPGAIWLMTEYCDLDDLGKFYGKNSVNLEVMLG